VYVRALLLFVSRFWHWISFVCLFVAGIRCLRKRKSGSYRTKFLVQLFEELDKALDLK